MADTELIDHTGRTVFRGTQKPPGGGSQPVTETLGGSAPATTVADGATGDLNAQHTGGDALLDYTNPAAPTVLADGLYALSAYGNCNSGSQIGGAWAFTVQLNGSGVSSYMTNTSPLNTPGSAALCGATVLGPLVAGDTITFSANNFSGIGSLDFLLNTATLVKLA